MPHTEVHGSPARLGPEGDWDPSHPDCFCFPLFPDILSPLKPPPPSDPPQPPCSASSSTRDSRCRGSREVPRTLSELKRGRRGDEEGALWTTESGAPVGVGPPRPGTEGSGAALASGSPLGAGASDTFSPSSLTETGKPARKSTADTPIPAGFGGARTEVSTDPAPRACALRNEAPIRLPRSQETDQRGQRGSFWEANRGLLRIQDCQATAQNPSPHPPGWSLRHSARGPGPWRVSRPGLVASCRVQGQRARVPSPGPGMTGALADNPGYLRPVPL